jgi:hypothetical protein
MKRILEEIGKAAKNSESGREGSSIGEEKRKAVLRSTKVEVSESTNAGITGGIGMEVDKEKTIRSKVRKRSDPDPTENSTTLLNTENAPHRIDKQKALAGGFENKSADEGKTVEKGISSFGVQGALGQTGAGSIEREKVDLKKKPEKPTESKEEETKAAEEKTKGRGEQQDKGTLSEQTIKSRLDKNKKGDPSRKYESRPTSMPLSDLSREREAGSVLYEAAAYKQRYFLSFLWVKRHFVITKDGRLKYYRDLDTLRRGEYSLAKDFVEISSKDTRGKFPYRISFMSSQEEYLAFEKEEERDEFFAWLNKATE